MPEPTDLSKVSTPDLFRLRSSAVTEANGLAREAPMFSLDLIDIVYAPVRRIDDELERRGERL